MAPRQSVADTIAHPVGEALSAPVRWTGDAVAFVGGYFFAVSENRRLRAQIVQLEQTARRGRRAWQTRMRASAPLLGLKTEPPIPMVAAHVIADSRGPFANTRLADAGVEQGVAIGNPVMSEHGLVGRIVGVAHGVSRVLLLTDVASRTPVLIDRTGRAGHPHRRRRGQSQTGLSARRRAGQGRRPRAHLGRRRGVAARPAGGDGGGRPRRDLARAPGRRRRADRLCAHPASSPTSASWRPSRR